MKKGVLLGVHPNVLHQLPQVVVVGLMRSTSLKSYQMRKQKEYLSVKTEIGG